MYRAGTTTHGYAVKRNNVQRLGGSQKCEPSLILLSREGAAAAAMNRSTITIPLLPSGDGVPTQVIEITMSAS